MRFPQRWRVLLNDLQNGGVETGWVRVPVEVSQRGERAAGDALDGDRAHRTVEGVEADLEDLAGPGITVNSTPAGSGHAVPW